METSLEFLLYTLSSCISRVIFLLKFVKGWKAFWVNQLCGLKFAEKVWRSWICWRHVNAIQSRGEDSKPDIFALAVLESADFTSLEHVILENIFGNFHEMFILHQNNMQRLNFSQHFEDEILDLQNFLFLNYSQCQVIIIYDS